MKTSDKRVEVRLSSADSTKLCRSFPIACLNSLYGVQYSKKLTVPQLVQKFPEFYETLPVHYRVHKSQELVPIQIQQYRYYNLFY